MTLDNIDRKILEILQCEGRISFVELSNRINLSQPATHVRIKQLEREGLIKKYVALLDSQKLDYDGYCFINVSLQLHQLDRVEEFRRKIQEMPEVLECFHITGEFDYILKVLVRNRKNLENFLFSKLTPITGVARIYTSLVLDEIKSTTKIPIEESE